MSHDCLLLPLSIAFSKADHPIAAYQKKSYQDDEAKHFSTGRWYIKGATDKNHSLGSSKMLGNLLNWESHVALEQATKTMLRSPSQVVFKAWVEKATANLAKDQWQSCFKWAAEQDEHERYLPNNISISSWMFLQVFTAWECCAIPSSSSFHWS